VRFFFDYRIRGHIVSVPHWYVGKLLFFFAFNLELGNPHGSLYAVVEVMNLHRTANHSKSIPMVQPFKQDSKKHVVIDVADITSVVGLIQKTDIVANTIKSFNWFYAIAPYTAFNDDMSTNAGQISNLL